jgi:hypothetical protein
LQIALAILGYSLCSSTLLLANKLSITYLPSASLLAFVQIVFSTIAVLIIQVTKLSEVDTLIGSDPRPTLSMSSSSY